MHLLRAGGDRIRLMRGLAQIQRGLGVGERLLQRGLALLVRLPQQRDFVGDVVLPHLLLRHLMCSLAWTFHCRGLLRRSRWRLRRSRPYLFLRIDSDAAAVMLQLLLLLLLLLLVVVVVVVLLLVLLVLLLLLLLVVLV